MGDEIKVSPGHLIKGGQFFIIYSTRIISIKTLETPFNVESSSHLFQNSTY